MVWKKLTACVVMGAMLFSLAACGASEKEETQVNVPEIDFKDKKIKVGMITDTGGVHDQSFNQSSWEGLDALQKKYPDQVSCQYLESQTDADYVKNIEAMIDEKLDIIIGIGYKMEAVINEAAKNYPDQKFAIVDAVGADQKGEIPKNVEGILFRADQASFLVGYIAAKMSKTGKIGHMNGMDAPVMNEFAAGYYAGAWTANPEVEIYGQYANSFSDVAKGKSIAEQLYSQNVDIIFACGGDTGNGVIDAAKEQKKFVIGVDRDQNYLAPEYVVTSAVKRVGDGIIRMVKDYVEGQPFGGQPKVYGLDSGAVGIAPTTNLIPADILKDVKDMQQKIIKGEQEVPHDEASLLKLFPNPKTPFMK